MVVDTDRACRCVALLSGVVHHVRLRPRRLAMSTLSTPLELRLWAALKRIASYQSPAYLHRHSMRDWGLADANEAIEMAYENVLQEAKQAVKGLRHAAKKVSHDPAR